MTMRMLQPPDESPTANKIQNGDRFSVVLTPYISNNLGKEIDKIKRNRIGRYPS